MHVLEITDPSLCTTDGPTLKRLERVLDFRAEEARFHYNGAQKSTQTVSEYNGPRLLDNRTDSEDFTSESNDGELMPGERNTNNTDEELFMTIQSKQEWDIEDKKERQSGRARCQDLEGVVNSSHTGPLFHQQWAQLVSFLSTFFNPLAGCQPHSTGLVTISIAMKTSPCGML